jgi:hypothetical protein
MIEIKLSENDIKRIEEAAPYGIAVGTHTLKQQCIQ